MVPVDIQRDSLGTDWTVRLLHCCAVEARCKVVSSTTKHTGRNCLDVFISEVFLGIDAGINTDTKKTGIY
jgi:hypothetical protein